MPANASLLRLQPSASPAHTAVSRPVLGGLHHQYSAFGRVPPGVASDKDQGRLLQGQESPRNVSERSIRLSRISLSTAAGEEVPGTHTVLWLQPSGQSR